MSTHLEQKMARYFYSPEFITEHAILTFTERVLELMDEMKMSKADLSCATGLDPARVSKILRGDHNITARTMGRIASALRMQMDFALYGPVRIDSYLVPEDVTAPSCEFCVTLSEKASTDDPSFSAAA